MNPKLSLALALALLSLCGCASPESVAHRDPYVKPGLIMLTADQAAARGIDTRPTEGPLPQHPQWEPLDSRAVATPPGVKVYTLNRAVDPADRELMHEEHVVYRRETAPQWVLDAPADQKILVGPRVTDGRQEIRPILDKELSAFLSDQRRATETNQRAIAVLAQEMQRLQRAASDDTSDDRAPEQESNTRRE